MSSLNKVLLVGRMGKDPELRHTQNGNMVTNFVLATSSNYNGNEITEWHTVVCWSKTAEFVNQYASKGQLTYVEGRIQTRKWEDRQGKDRWVTEIIADNVQLIGRPKNNNNEVATPQFGDMTPRPQVDTPAHAHTLADPSGFTEDDIPF